MSNIPVARRYARALLDATGDAADETLSQLEALTRYFEGEPQLFETLSSPALTKSQRLALMEVILTKSPGLQKVVANLMRLLNDRNRFGALPAITRQFRTMVDTRMGRIRGRISSASKLGESQVAALKKQLETLTRRTVVLETKVDPGLIGGLVAQVGSHMYDGSLRSQLTELSRVLTSR